MYKKYILDLVKNIEFYNELYYTSLWWDRASDAAMETQINNCKHVKCNLSLF